MASAPNGNRFDLHIRRIPGGLFTDGRLPALAEGERLDVELPLGSFFLRKADFRPLLMVATGTGLAPIKSILESLMEEPDDCPPSLLYWGTREPNGLYLHDDIATWSERLSEFEYRPVLSRAGAGLGRPPGLCPGRGPQRHRGPVRIRDLSLRLADYGGCGQGAVHPARRQPQSHLRRQFPLPAQSLIAPDGPPVGDTAKSAILLFGRAESRSAKPCGKRPGCCCMLYSVCQTGKRFPGADLPMRDSAESHGGRRR